MPTVTSETQYSFTIRATDAQGQTADQAFTLTSEVGIQTLEDSANGISIFIKNTWLHLANEQKQQFRVGLKMNGSKHQGIFGVRNTWF